MLKCKPCSFISLLLFFLFILFNSISAAKDRPTVALVLSGGGARGLAQIGVLKVFEQCRLPVDYIAGTSIGAIIGGLYAAGYSADSLQNIVRRIDWESLFGLRSERERTNQFLDQRSESDRSFLEMRFSHWKLVIPPSISLGYRISALLQELVWNAPYHSRNFDFLKIPFRAVATDLVHGQGIVLRSGNLARALRASATVPIQYAPVPYDSLLLVDGGLFANIPVQAVKEFKPDIILVVNTTSPLYSSDMLDNPWRIADQVVSITIMTQNQKSLRAADFVIEPDLEGIQATDFHRTEEIIKRGVEAAQAAIPDILSLFAATADRKPHDSSDTPRQYIRHIQWIATDLPYLLDSIACSYIGQPLTFENLRNLRETCLLSLRSRKYAYADVPILDIDSTNGRLILGYTEGRIDTIVIEGNETIPTRQILQYLQIRPGDIFQTDKAIRGWKLLMGTGFFSDVGVDAWQLQNGKIQIVYSVRERPTKVLRLTGKIDNEREVQIFAGLADENFLSNAHRLSFWFGGGKRNFLAVLNFQLSSLLVPRLSLLSSVRYEYWEYYRYQEKIQQNRWEYLQIGDEAHTKLTVAISAYQRIEQDGMLFGEIRFGSIRTRVNDRDVMTTTEGVFFNGKLGLRYDSRNAVDLPDSGRVIMLSFESPLFVLPNSYRFSRAEVLFERWQRFGEDLHIHTRFFAGFGDRTLPQGELYRLGGIRTFPVLYESQWTGTQTLQGSIQILKSLPVHFVFDSYLGSTFSVAQLWNQPASLRFENFRFSLGLNLFFLTPIGPAQFTFGKGFFVLDNRLRFTPLRFAFEVGKGFSN